MPQGEMGAMGEEMEMGDGEEGADMMEGGEE
jgi:hypothetical protein